MHRGLLSRNAATHGRSRTGACLRLFANKVTAHAVPQHCLVMLCISIVVQDTCTTPFRDRQMQTISTSDLRATFLKYREIAISGEQFTVTSNDKFLTTIIPPRKNGTCKKNIGRLKRKCHTP